SREPRPGTPRGSTGRSSRRGSTSTTSPSLGHRSKTSSPRGRAGGPPTGKPRDVPRPRSSRRVLEAQAHARLEDGPRRAPPRRGPAVHDRLGAKDRRAVQDVGSAGGGGDERVGRLPLSPADRARDGADRGPRARREELAAPLLSAAS